MSDRPAATFPGAGQPQETQPVTQPTGESVTQPKYVTMEEAQRLANEAAEQVFRRAQGLVQKSSNAIEAKIRADLTNLDNTIKMQRAAGVDLSADVEARLKQQVINQAYLTPDQASPTGQTAAQPPVQTEPPPDPITAEAWRMMAEAGVEISDDDPLLVKTGTAYQFLQSVQTAINAKRSQPAAQQSARLPQQAPTNLGGTGQVANQYIGKVMDPDQIWREMQNK